MLTITRDENGRITHIQSDGPVLMTGPIRGSLVLADGSVVDVTQDVIELPVEQHAEVSDLIGKYWEANGHPHDVEWDDEAQATVQRPFVYLPPAAQEHSKGKGKS